MTTFVKYDGGGCNLEAVLAVDADGNPLRLGDAVVWSNGENVHLAPDDRDDDEMFVLRGLITVGGADGDVFLLDADRRTYWLGNCRKEA